MSGARLRVGTRGSPLALAQSGAVAAAVAAALGAEVELVRIRTEGDVNAGPLATIGGTGVFVGAVRDGLLAGDVDIVVHSFKDLPTAVADGITLGAVPMREHPADALCAAGRTLAELPAGARIGTGSPRRRAQILSSRPDLTVVDIRGNVDTRLARVAPDDLDGVVLAAAGLRRLGRQAAISDEFDPEVFLPAPAQGALAVERRSGDSCWYAAGLEVIDSPRCRWAAIAERAVLAGLAAGCSAPVSAYGIVTGTELALSAQVTSVDGSRALRRDHSGAVTDDETAGRFGQALAEMLLDAGAADLLGQA